MGLSSDLFVACSASWSIGRLELLTAVRTPWSHTMTHFNSLFFRSVSRMHTMFPVFRFLTWIVMLLLHFINATVVHNFRSKIVFFIVCAPFLSLFHDGPEVFFIFRVIFRVFRSVAMLAWFASIVISDMVSTYGTMVQLALFFLWRVLSWLLHLVGFEIWHLPVCMAFLFMPKRDLVS